MNAGTRIWKPTVTVAAIIERDGRFLLVEEHTAHGVLFNQPAGHLEPGESLIEGAAREALEETAYSFTSTALLGVYQFHYAAEDVTYLRFAFIGEVSGHDPARRLDDGIIRCVWMTPDEIRATRERHRSPLVARCVADYLAGQRHALGVLVRHEA
jgi:8-oxo-dGTP pyrophosphatase MutT (NUDIX family)